MILEFRGCQSEGLVQATPMFLQVEKPTWDVLMLINNPSALWVWGLRTDREDARLENFLSLRVEKRLLNSDLEKPVVLCIIQEHRR